MKSRVYQGSPEFDTLLYQKTGLLHRKQTFVHKTHTRSAFSPFLCYGERTD
jgi:hypothetical protein